MINNLSMMKPMIHLIPSDRRLGLEPLTWRRMASVIPAPTCVRLTSGPCIPRFRHRALLNVTSLRRRVRVLALICVLCAVGAEKRLQYITGRTENALYKESASPLFSEPSFPLPARWIHEKYTYIADHIPCRLVNPDPPPTHN